MKHVNKSVLLWYSAQEMYQLVTAVTEYAQFLPWCARGEILQTHADGVTAKLHVSYHGVRHAFTTRNTEVPGERVTLKLVDGPFSQLEGQWRFMPVGSKSDATGGVTAGAPQACRVEFNLSYAFASRALEVMVSPVFDKIANTFVDAFVKRAGQVYGPR